MPKQEVEEFGWTAVPRNRSNIPSAKDADTRAAFVISADIWPNTQVVKKAQEYARKELLRETYNHSLRVYCYGTSTWPLMLQKKEQHRMRRPSQQLVNLSLLTNTPPRAHDCNPTLPYLGLRYLVRNLGSYLPVSRRRHNHQQSFGYAPLV
jgi:hypothetical protein